MLSWEVSIRSEDTLLPGELALPAGATGLVIFAHGTGSSRHSARNRHVAEVLNEAGLGTLLFDLLTLEEEKAERLSAHLRFNIDLLSQRLVDATGAVRQEEAVRNLPIGYFGADTGAAAALVAASQFPNVVTAVVCRAGRPDLVAVPLLAAIEASTLFIVGEQDRAVFSANRRVLPLFKARTELRAVAGANHGFEEPGALDCVANLARDWFDLHLSRPRSEAGFPQARINSEPYRINRFQAP